MEHEGREYPIQLKNLRDKHVFMITQNHIESQTTDFLP